MQKSAILTTCFILWINSLGKSGMKEDDEEEEGMGRRRRGGEVINQFAIFINPEKEEEELAS